MKSLIVILSFMVLSLNTFSQNWNGIPISGNFATLKANLLAKGFKLIGKENNFGTFKGNINGIEYEIISYSSPITDQLAKLIIYFPQKYSWSSIKSEFEYLREMFNEKYGVGECYYYFDDPYYEGDGYEMSAIKQEKCHYSCYWLNIPKEPNLSVSTTISSFQQVKVTYENNKNMEKAKEETDKINKKIF